MKEMEYLGWEIGGRCHFRRCCSDKMNMSDFVHWTVNTGKGLDKKSREMAVGDGHRERKRWVSSAGEHQTKNMRHHFP